MHANEVAKFVLTETITMKTPARHLISNSFYESRQMTGKTSGLPRYALFLTLSIFQLQSHAEPAKDSPVAVCRAAARTLNGTSQPDLYRKVKEFDARIRAAKETDELAAIRLMVQKLEFIDAAPGCKLEELKRALNELAYLHESRDRYREAEPYLLRLLQLAKDEHPAGELWRVRRRLADGLEAQGQYAAALPHWQAALAEQPEVYLHGDDTRIRAGLVNNLLQQKRYAEAEPFLRGYALAEALEGQGKWKEAEAIWRNQPTTPDTLQRLEANLRQQGRTAESVKVAEQAFALKNAPKNPTPRANKQDAEGTRKAAQLMESAGNSQLAEMMRAMAARQELATRPAVNEKGEMDPALLEASKAQLAFLIKEAERQGDKAKADMLRSMQAMIGQSGGRGTPNWATPPQNLGTAPERATLALKQIEVGQTQEAEKALREACPAFVKRDRIDLPKDSTVDFRLPALTVQQCFRELALATVNNWRLKTGQPNEELFVAAQWATQSEAGSALTRNAARKYAASFGAGALLDQIDVNLAVMRPHAEKFAAKVMEFQATQDKRLKQDRQDPDAVGILFTLMSSVQEIDSATRPNSEAIERLYLELQTKAPTYSALRNPEPIALASLVANSGADARLLLPDEALILWMSVPGTRKGLVFAISKERSAWAVMGLTGDEIAQRVTRLRSQIDPCAYGSGRTNCKNERLSFDRKAAYELHQALLGQPEISAVVNAKGISSLLVVPSGVLTTLPPGVLVTSPPVGGADLDQSPDGWSLTDWLILKRSITIIPAVSTLAALRGPQALRAAPPTRGADDRLFMFADPDFSGTAKKPVDCSADRPRSVARSPSYYLRSGGFDRQALSTLSPLPCTRREGELLKAQLGGKVLYGPDAREAQFRNRDLAGRMSRAEVFAFATHGLVAGDLGLGEPALALAAPLAGESADDGVLTASEIMQLKLSADIVLLSACNTASPDTKDADGLSGLAKAFFQAGANGVLVSHWRVDDAATSSLIAETIRLRRTGLGKAKSLQLASVALMQGTVGAQDEAARERRSHPSIWAPFTLIGEAR